MKSWSDQVGQCLGEACLVTNHLGTFPTDTLHNNSGPSEHMSERQTHKILLLDHLYTIIESYQNLYSVCFTKEISLLQLEQH